LPGRAQRSDPSSALALCPRALVNGGLLNKNREGARWLALPIETNENDPGGRPDLAILPWPRGAARLDHRRARSAPGRRHHAVSGAAGGLGPARLSGAHRRLRPRGLRLGVAPRLGG